MNSEVHFFHQLTVWHQVNSLTSLVLSSLVCTGELVLWFYSRDSQPMDHDLFGVEEPFHGSHLRPLENVDIYITINNGSKIIVVK